jgi:hypothetical protein
LARLVSPVDAAVAAERLSTSQLDVVEDPAPKPPVNLIDQAAQAFRSASQRINEAIEAVQEPGHATRHPGRARHPAGLGGGVLRGDRGAAAIIRPGPGTGHHGA